MTSRWVRHVVFTALALTACGGTVREDTGTPAEQLQSTSGSRCKAACEKVLACGLGGKQSCDCACACPDGGLDCQCGACNCPASTEETPAQCESDCNESVQKTLASSTCAPAMLNLLDCLPSASCEGGQRPCQAETDAMKKCMEADQTSRDSSSAPTVSRGSASGSDASAVTCRSASGSGAAPVQGSTIPAGTVSCTTDWDSCSDGKSYGIECRVSSGTSLDCTCKVDGTPGLAFTAAECPQGSADVNRSCGWHLE